jgi:aminoglycoside 6'-N-acetyltransferase I
MEIRVVPCTSLDPRWIARRARLWPETDIAAHYREASAQLRTETPFVALLALVLVDVAGFAEVRLRHDPVNGCATSPVAFLEGIWVDAPFRRRGVARALVAAALAWAQAAGCSEFASDALLENLESHAWHRALGFAETERVVYFRKALAGPAAR